jgi:hypothetical protein
MGHAPEDNRTQSDAKRPMIHETLSWLSPKKMRHPWESGDNDQQALI